ncbi:hypothetical protein [Parasutterella muris]|uniref:hypothetical protein n=1 Tax=Parasutterella muris TaxID=2565572 RepID=UPI00203E5553|nr:hypothetical protein [Parasutterella muris]
MITEIVSLAQLAEILRKKMFPTFNAELPTLDFSLMKLYGVGPLILLLELKKNKRPLSIREIKVKNLLIQPIKYDRQSINFSPIEGPSAFDWQDSVRCAINVPVEGSKPEFSALRQEGFVLEAFWAKPLNNSREITVTAVSTEWFTSIKFCKVISLKDI